MPTQVAFRPQVRSARTAPSAHIPSQLPDKLNEQIDETAVVVDSPQRNKLAIGTTAAIAVAAAAAVLFPDASQAIDLASVSVGASALATSTNSFFASVGETGFYQAFSLVFVSEIGDKTFFIAGLLAAKFSKLISFVGSMGALAVMTIISVLIGQIFHVIPSGIAEGIPLDDVAAVLAFTFFGFKTLKEALDMEEGTSVMDEEFEEAGKAVEGSGTEKQGTSM
jgi:putative Ca2+/H+ antiporter (TMEM165/GDT1 family)